MELATSTNEPIFTDNVTYSSVLGTVLNYRLLNTAVDMRCTCPPDVTMTCENKIHVMKTLHMTIVQLSTVKYLSAYNVITDQRLCSLRD